MSFAMSRPLVDPLGAMLLSAVLVLCPGTALAQRWFNLGPDGAPVSGLAGSFWNPQVLYAIGNHVPFRTTDGGAHWEPKPLSGDSGRFPLASVAADPFDPATVYVGASDGIFKSTDGGGSWQRLDASPQDVRAIAIHPWTPTTMYATGSPWYGVHKTIDGGVTWTTVAEFGLGEGVNAIAIDPWRPDIVYAASKGRVYKSVDGGFSWVPMPNGLPVPVWGSEIGIVDIAIDLWNPDTIYLVAAIAPVYKSTDGGASWAPLDAGATHVNAVAIDPATPAVYAASTVNGLVRSTDGGTTWIASSLNPTTLQVKDVLSNIFAPGTMYVGTEHRIFKTTDGGDTWVAANTGLRSAPVRSVAIDPWSAAMYIAGATGVHESRDFGLTWAARSTGLHAIPGPGNPRNFCVTPSNCLLPLNDLVLDTWNPGTMYVGGGTRSVAKTTDGGLGWTDAAAGLDERIALSIAASPARSGTLYAGTVDGLFKSSDAGVTWTPTGLSAPDRTVDHVRVDPQNADVVYAVRKTPSRYTIVELLKSTDGGATWNRVPTPVVSLAISPSDPSVMYGSTPGRVMRSSDGGSTWEDVSIVGATARAIVVDPWTPTTVYAAGDAFVVPVVFKSVDAGANWTPIVDGHFEALGPFNFVNTLAVHPWFPNLLYAGTDAGVAVLVQ